jgi:hypothetical protein
VWTPEEGRVQQTGPFDVGQVATISAEQTRILNSLNAGAEQAWRCRLKHEELLLLRIVSPSDLRSRWK